MKTIKEWEQDITRITMIINQKFPEISKYIKEMPERVSEDPKETSDVEQAEEYYKALVYLLTEYSKTHSGIKVKDDVEKPGFSGYPSDPHSKDNLIQEKKDEVLNPGDKSNNRAPNEDHESMNEKTIDDAISAVDSDVIGSNLGDTDEGITDKNEGRDLNSGQDDHIDVNNMIC